MKVGDLVKWHRYGEESVIGIVLFKEDTGECVVWWSDDCDTSEGEKAGELGVEVIRVPIKVGDLVKDKNGRIGISRGPTVAYGVKWIMVDWKGGGTAIVLEEFLEVIK